VNYVSKIKVLIITPPASKVKKWDKNYLASYLEHYLLSKGFIAMQLVNSNKMGIEELISEIFRISPKYIILNSYVGFGCYDENIYYLEVISKFIKIKCNAKIIVIGTSTINNFNEFVNCENFDYIIKGDPEIPVFRLLNKLESRKKIDIIKGVSYKKGDHEIVDGGEYFLKNLDILPSPILLSKKNNESNFIIITSRGCCFSCMYCMANVSSKKNIREHSIERVVQELQYIYTKYGSVTITILDDIFVYNKKRIKELCYNIIQKNIKLNYIIETRIDTIDDELIFLLAKIGVKNIDCGLETLDIEVRKKIKKGYNDENIANKFIDFKKKCELKGIKVMYNYIIGLGTIDQMVDTKNFILDIGVKYSQNILRVYKNSEMMSMINNICYNKFTGYYYYNVNVNNFEMTMKSAYLQSEFYYFRSEVKRLFCHSTFYIDIEIGKNIDKLRETYLDEYIFIKETKYGDDQIIDILKKYYIPTTRILFVTEIENTYVIREYAKPFNKVIIYKYFKKNIEKIKWNELFLKVSNSEILTYHPSSIISEMIINEQTYLIFSKIAKIQSRFLFEFASTIRKTIYEINTDDLMFSEINTDEISLLKNFIFFLKFGIMTGEEE